MAFRSAPAQNAPPAPVSTQARMPGSLSTVSQASRIPASIGPLSALRFSGRFMVTISTAPRCSVSRCGRSGPAAAGAAGVVVTSLSLLRLCPSRPGACPEQ